MVVSGIKSYQSSSVSKINILSVHALLLASKAATALNAEKSPAVPFLPYPENLKGYTGDDVGFDPLRISDYFPMDYLRESELK